MSADELQRWKQWCADRTRSVTSTPGNLTLVSYQALGDQWAPIEGAVEASARVADGEGIWLRTPEGYGVTVDGEPVAGEVFVGRLRAGTGPVVRREHFAYEVFSLDGSDYELRVYDEYSDALDNFGGIEVYDYAPEFLLTGEFHAYGATDAVPWAFTRSVDTGHVKQVPGTVMVSISGVRHELVAFLDGSELVIVFADATTGAESYAPGRFLRTQVTGDRSSVSVDFNRAFIPPCGFSDFYSCPIPPPQNKLALAVRAGERRVCWQRPRY
ncbi:DUF1684 domain-containing protein [Kribbella sancticallisti]|uniref:DUF1684 domain-containing protein n=1 Tax=Kribbella sancticallisti TaxID=460087 RepID=A0ABN2C852_9ACTN